MNEPRGLSKPLAAKLNEYPYQILQPGGTIEAWNEEAGAAWLARLQRAYPRHALLNPEPEDRWDYVPSIGVARQLLESRTYPLTLARIDRVTRALNAR